MNTSKISLSLGACAALAACLACGSAAAQNYTFKLGGAFIEPNATSSDFDGKISAPFPTTTPGVHLEVKSKSTLLFSLERSINDNFGVELVLGAPPRHDVKLKVPAAVLANPQGKAVYGRYADQTIATVKQIAPTLFFNYHYGSASDTWRPYLGLGINYTRLDSKLNSAGRAFYNGVGATDMKLHLSPSIGPAVQAGVTYKINKDWSLNAGVASSFVSSKLTVTNQADGSVHTAKFDFTPTVYTATVGYSF